VVPVITASHAEARATLRAQMAATCLSDLNKAFAVWLLRDPEQSADLASIVDQAAKREGADQDFQTAALLGFAAAADVLSEAQVGALKRSLHRLAGRSSVVNGVPMAFCSDAVGLLGVALGTGTLAETDVTAEIVGWAGKFLRSSYERDGVEDWRRCLLAVAGRYLGKPLDLEIPLSVDTADVRTALVSRRLLDVGDKGRVREDAAETLKLAVQEPPTNLTHDRAALRLAALEWVIHTSRRPAGSRDRTKGSMDRPSQADPIWRITATQKGPIPVTRLNGEVVWFDDTATHEPDDAVLAPGDEQRIAEVTMSGRSELRSEIEKLFSGPDWPLASVIVEPFRRYAVNVFDVNAVAYRNVASTQAKAPHDVLNAMVRNLLSELFGREWENSPGETVTRTDWQNGVEGWKGKEFVVIAGNDPDPSCQYHELISDAIKYRYRFHAVLPAPIPGEPPGINLSNVEWWQYIGLNERHNLAMAIKPYLEDRKEHWQAICASRRTTDSSNGTENAPRESEQPGTREAQSAKESRKATTPIRRNQKYKVIDEALRKIAESVPRTQEEVFQSLEGRHVVVPPAEPFMTARGWIAGFRRDAAAARAWLSKRWKELSLSPLPRGPKNPKK
jgi:hypothetical protein